MTTKLANDQIKGHITGVVGEDIYPALAAAIADNTISEIRLPAGVFTLSQTVVINKAIRIDGAGGPSATEFNATGQPGTSTTRLICTGTNINGIEIVGDGTEGVENVHLSNFSLWGGPGIGIADQSTMNDGILVGTTTGTGTVSKSSFKNVHVRGFDKTGKFGIRFRRALEFYMENVYTQFNSYGWGNIEGDICTTMRTMNVNSRTNVQNGMFIGGTFTGAALTGVLNEGNGDAGMKISPTNASVSSTDAGRIDFFGYYSEFNNAPGLGANAGSAPIEIGTSAGNATNINFYGGSITDDATARFGGRSITLDNCGDVTFSEMELTTFNPGFMTATTNTTGCVFRTSVKSVKEKDVTGNGIFSGNSRVTVEGGAAKIAVGSISRDISAADGAVIESGLGFLPRVIQFQAVVDNTSMMSMGMTDGTSQLSVHDSHGVTIDTYGVVAGTIVLRSGGSVLATGTVTITDIGEFTITWAKTGSPTGTGTIQYTVFG